MAPMPGQWLQRVPSPQKDPTLGLYIAPHAVPKGGRRLPLSEAPLQSCFSGQREHTYQGDHHYDLAWRPHFLCPLDGNAGLGTAAGAEEVGQDSYRRTPSDRDPGAPTSLDLIISCQHRVIFSFLLFEQVVRTCSATDHLRFYRSYRVPL